MRGFLDILGSEKGIVGLMLIIGATVLTAIGRLPIDQWQEYTLWVFGIYAGTKTLTSATAMITKSSDPPPAPAPTPAPTPASSSSGE